MGRVLALVFVAYAALTLYVTLHHEPWRDEADTWLLARDATLSETLRIPAHRGVPLLWDFMLRPFAKAGAPYLAQQLLNLACMWGAVLLLMRSSAFPPLLKRVFPFSFYASFEYAVIARPYALLMLLLFAMAECWRTREEKPLRLAIVIALLANATVHGLIAAAVAGALVVVKWIRSRRFAAIAIAILGGLIAVAQLWPRPGGQKVYQVISTDTLWYSLATAFFPDLRIESGAVLALFVLAVVTIAVSRRFAPVVFLWTTLIAVLLIFVFIWMGGPRHAGILLALTMTAVWMADSLRHERLVMAALSVALALSIVPAYRSWRADVKDAYSRGREMASYVRSNGLERANFAVGPLTWNSWMVDLPHTRVWQPERGAYGSFSRWGRGDQTASLERTIRAAQAHFRGEKWFIMLSRSLPEEFSGEFRLRYETPPLRFGPRDERYWLYEAVNAP